VKKKTTSHKKIGRAKKSATQKPRWIGGIADVCDAINLRERRVFQLIKEGLPRLDRGLYDVGAVAAWYVRYLQQKLFARANPAPNSADAAGLIRHRMLSIEVEMKQIELAEKREGLISVERVQKDTVAIVAEIKRRVLALPPVIATAVLAETDIAVAQVRVDSILKDSLARLSEFDPEAVQPASPSRSSATSRTQ
jgi:hypothetical protein